VQFSDEYIGVITNNFWGHEFWVYDHGVEEKVAKNFPSGFIKQREEQLYIKYETNILGEVPRSLKCKWKSAGETYSLINVPPKWNDRTECYTLNFYG